MPVKVLVVEDDADLRSLVEFKLLKRGFEVESASDGDAAFRLLNSGTYDVVVLDIMLPRLSGFQIMRQLVEQHKQLPAKFIVLSAINNEEDILHALNLGVTEYMIKPFSLEVLVAQVRKAAGLLPWQRADAVAD